MREPERRELTRKSDIVYAGEYSAGIESNNVKTGEVANEIVYPSGGNPSRLVFYWQESYTSNGGALRFKNSNGEYEGGFASGNPAWHILGKDGSTRYQNDGYGQWVRVEYRFDWSKNLYYYTVTDLSDGKSVTGKKSLRHGLDIREITISNGRSLWNDGEDLYMWFDEITIDEDVDPSINVRETVGVNRSVTFDGRQSYGAGYSWEWDFGDGATAAGKLVNHTYESPGEYNVTLTLTNNSRQVQTTKKIDVRSGYYSEGFEGVAPLSTWDNTVSKFQQDTLSQRNGLYSAGVSDEQAPRIVANDTIYDGGGKPKEISYYYRESSSSNGGGIRFVNSEGDYEFGIATDNPEFYISDANGTEQVGYGDYDRWIPVTVRLNWTSNTFHYNINEGESTGTGELKQGVDIEKISIENFCCETWRDSTDMYMNFDDIVVKESG